MKGVEELNRNYMLNQQIISYIKYTRDTDFD